MYDRQSQMKVIRRAVDIVGSQVALARAIDAKFQAVYQWVHGIRPIPPVRCRAIEAATGGKVTVHDLRPDVFGPKRHAA